MKKTLIALATALTLALTPAAAFAEETEASADSDILYLQGVDEDSCVWTVGLDFANEYGVVNLQQPDENGEYLEENEINVFGSMTYDDVSMTITDDEDGLDYVFGMTSTEDGSGVVMTYEPIESEVTLSIIDSNLVASEDDNMIYYAGFDADGLQWTVGFDFDQSIIAMNVMDSEGNSNTVGGTFVDDEEGTLTITLEDGSEQELYYEWLDDSYNVLQLSDGEDSFVVSYIDTTVLDEVA